MHITNIKVFSIRSKTKNIKKECKINQSQHPKCIEAGTHPNNAIDTTKNSGIETEIITKMGLF